MNAKLTAFTLKLLVYLLIAAGMIAVLAFFLVAFSRLSYPYDLEWLEGSSLAALQRIRAGLPLYTAPSVDYVPLIYTPLYFYLGAAVSFLASESFSALRIVSLASTMTILVLLFAIVRAETRRGLAAFLAAALFAACYGLTTAWFDLARVDMLFVCLLLAGAAALKQARSIPAGVLAGVLLAACFLTKQSSLGYILPLLVFAALFLDRRAALSAAASALAISAAACLAWNAASQGWFNFYIFSLPRTHNLLPLNALTYLPFEVLRPFGITLTLVLLSLVLPRERPQRRADDYYPFFALTALGASWLARANNGGALNTLLPVCAALALMLGLAFDRLLAATKALPEGRQAAASGVLYLLALAQLLALAYNPFAQLPSQQQRQSSDALLAVLSQIDGDVFIPSKAYLSTMTGKAPTAATVNLFELNGHFTTAGLDEQRATPIAQAIAAALASRRYALLVVDNVDASLFGPELDTYYQPVRFPQLEGHNAYFSVHTWMANTELKFYVPR